MHPWATAALKKGILDMPEAPVWGKPRLREVPQTEEERAYGLAEIEKGLKEDSQLWEEMTQEEVARVELDGYMISSAFTHWEGMTEEGDRKGRFVQNFKVMSKWWESSGGVRLDKPAEYALGLQKTDHFLGFDIKGGYRHFYLAPEMRDFFCFHYAGRFFRCIALPFGWSRSPYWFITLLKPFVRVVRSRWNYRLLAYIDDFLCNPTSGDRPATAKDCEIASKRLDGLMERLGIMKHPTKGVWGNGSTVIDHLGVRWDSMNMRFTITEEKQEKVRSWAEALVHEAVRGRRWVSRNSLRSFAGTVVSLQLAMPLARFYSREFFNAVEDYSCARQMPAARGGERTRISNRALKDLRQWRRLGQQGRKFREEEPEAALHTDAAELGYGGTLGRRLEAGADGAIDESGTWTAEERRESITLRELKAVTRVLGGGLGVAVQRWNVKRLKLWVDNLGVKFIVQKMCSSSPEIMREVRVLERLLHSLGISIDPGWLPSAANFYADRLSRTWDPGDLQVRASLRKELATLYAHVVPRGDRAECFEYRPLGVPPIARRKQTLGELQESWSGRARLYFPPVDLIAPTVAKMKREKAKGVIVVPNWPGATWWPALMGLSNKSWVVRQTDPRTIWAGRRALNPQWSLRVVEVGL